MAMLGNRVAAAWRTQLCSRTGAALAGHTLRQQTLSPVLLGHAASIRSCAATALLPSRHQVMRMPQTGCGGSNLEVMNSRSLVNVAVDPSSDVLLPFTIRRKASAAVRQKRDPERPKIPSTPWIRYLAHFRQADGKDLGNRKVMLAASTKWKALPASERRRWEEPYQIEKKEYEKKMKAYIESGKRDAWKRDPEKPKVPMTGFLRFAGEYRNKHKELKLTEVTKAAATLWKEMSPAKRAPYEKQYTEAKAKYAEAMKKYKDSGKQAAWEKKVGIAEGKEKLAEAAKKKKEAAAKKKLAAATKKKTAAAKRKEAAAKKKAAAAKKKQAAAKKKAETAKKKEAAAKKKKAAAAKKKAAAAKNKQAAAKKKAAAAKKKEAAAKKKAAAAKEKEVAKKKAATAKEKAAAAKQKAEAKKTVAASSTSKPAPPPPPPR